MATAQITLQVDAETARAFQSATAEEKAKAAKLFCLFVRRFSETDPDSLLALMKQISDEAQRNGLTEEILNEILHEKE